MNIEGNLNDFEKQLEESKESLEIMKSCVDDSILSPIERMIREWENHLGGDVYQLKDDYYTLEDVCEELRERIKELEDQLED